MNKSYIKYIVSLLLFGMNGIVASFISMSGYEIVFTRTFIGGIFLAVIFIVSRKKLTCFNNKKHLVMMILSGVSMGVSWMFLFEAYSKIGVSLATLAYYCGPGIIVVLSPLIFKEKLNAPKIIGFIIVLSGLFLTNCGDVMEGGFSWGLVCGIMSAVTYAAMIIFNKKAESINGLENSMLQLIIGFITVAIFVVFRQGVSFGTIVDNWAPILVLGVINTGVGCYFYFSSLQKLPAGTVALCSYIDPLSALLFSALFLGERLTFVQLCGATLILGGAVIGGRMNKKTRSAK